MFKKESNNTITNFSLGVILFMIFFYVLFIWASFIIPFIIAILFSIAIIWLSNFYAKFKIWKVLSFILSILTYIVIFWMIWKLINSNIWELLRLLPDYQIKVLSIIYEFLWYFGIDEITGIDEIFNKLDLQYIFLSVFWWITSIFSSAWIILFYVIFILLEYRYFGDKLRLMITEEHKRKQFLNTIVKIKRDIKSYFVIKTVVSLITASVSFIVMRIFWLDFAIFWAFLIFILNFIPSVWSVISVSFPILLSLIQFESYYQIVFIISGLVWIQIIMWNIIEPRFVWNKLNLSPLVIILALTFWWSIWWVVGMLLSVPIMVIVNIILSEISATRWVAILLSEKWELQIEAEEVIQTRKKFFSKFKGKFKRGK